MRRIYLSVFFVLLLAACGGVKRTQQALNTGNYMQAINRSVRELAENKGVPSYLIDEASQIRSAWLEDKQCIGVTAGASAPEDIVTGVVEQLCAWGAQLAPESQGKKEPVTFALPAELKAAARP